MQKSIIYYSLSLPLECDLLAAAESRSYALSSKLCFTQLYSIYCFGCRANLALVSTGGGGGGKQPSVHVERMQHNIFIQQDKTVTYKYLQFVSCITITKHTGDPLKSCA